jgi:hypothetical protein
LEKGFAGFAALAENKLKSFSAGACTWRKIPLRLQVWNLFSEREQILRAADCKNPPQTQRGFGAV